MKFISNLEQNKIKNVEIITDEGAVYSHIIEWKCLLLCLILYNIIKFLQSAENPITKVHITNIRNLLYGININKEEIRVSDIGEEKQMVYKPQTRLQQAGFSSYGTLFLTVLFFADVLVIALWIFKLLMK